MPSRFAFLPPLAFLICSALPAPALTSMKTLVTAYVQQAGSGDVERYLRGVELSALRAALREYERRPESAARRAANVNPRGKSRTA